MKQRFMQFAAAVLAAVLAMILLPWRDWKRLVRRERKTNDKG